mmetsp:Transcript_101736/g.317883  ORF Transcript_101736/g.317883 Transcript_101736/m.317883 type:complete len:225 (-) Transcript_101736:15-689(-)
MWPGRVQVRSATFRGPGETLGRTALRVHTPLSPSRACARPARCRSAASSRAAAGTFSSPWPARRPGSPCSTPPDVAQCLLHRRSRHCFWNSGFRLWNCCCCCCYCCRRRRCSRRGPPRPRAPPATPPCAAVQDPTAPCGPYQGTSGLRAEALPRGRGRASASHSQSSARPGPAGPERAWCRAPARRAQRRHPPPSLQAPRAAAAYRCGLGRASPRRPCGGASDA